MHLVVQLMLQTPAERNQVFMEIIYWLKRVWVYLNARFGRGPTNPYFKPRLFNSHRPSRSSEIDQIKIALDMLRSSEPEIQWRGVDSIQWSNDPRRIKATSMLVQLADKADPGVRRRLLGILYSIGARRQVPLKLSAEQLCPAVLRLSLSELTDRTQSRELYEIADLLGAHGKKAFPILRGFMDGIEPELARFYLRALVAAKGGREVSVAKLKEYSMCDCEDSAIYAIRLLAQYGDEVRNHLTLVLLAGSPAVREVCAEVLQPGTSANRGEQDGKLGLIRLLIRNQLQNIQVPA